MALIQCNFFSEALGECTTIDVILPQPVAGKPARATRYPVLWLLHGLSDDHTIWQRRTSIERYVEPMNLAVVMPAVGRSFYTDMARGQKYWTFVSEELPSVARHFFPLSTRRDENFVAGLSMGGYGAFKLALTYPNRYAAAASLSGALRRFSDDLSEASADPAWIAELENIFGDLTRFPGSRHDVYHLAGKVARTKSARPLLYQCCGTEDFLYQDNLRFKAHAEQLGLPLTYEEGPGEHEWGYWDRMIRRVLAWVPC